MLLSLRMPPPCLVTVLFSKTTFVSVAAVARLTFSPPPWSPVFESKWTRLSVRVALSSAMPPPSLFEALPESRTSVRVSVLEAFLAKIPPPLLAEFPECVELVSVAVVLSTKIPPPSLPAVLPETVTLRVPGWLRRPRYGCPRPSRSSSCR